MVRPMRPALGTLDLNWSGGKADIPGQAVCELEQCPLRAKGVIRQPQECYRDVPSSVGRQRGNLPNQKAGHHGPQTNQQDDQSPMCHVERPSSATAAGNARSAATAANKLPEPSNCPAGRRFAAALWLGARLMTQYLRLAHQSVTPSRPASPDKLCEAPLLC